MKLVTWLSVLVLVGVCRGETYTVNQNGTADFTTIQQAISSVSDGSVIEVAAGTYVENVNFIGKAIRLRKSKFNVGSKECTKLTFCRNTVPEDKRKRNGRVSASPTFNSFKVAIPEEKRKNTGSVNRSTRIHRTEVRSRKNNARKT